MFEKMTMEKVDTAITELLKAVEFAEKYGNAITHVSTNTLKTVLDVCKFSLDAHLRINSALKRAGYVR